MELLKSTSAEQFQQCAEFLKMGGRKSHSELRPNVVALSKQLRKRQKSLREISRELAARGHLSRSGKPFTARSVSNMLEVS